MATTTTLSTRTLNRALLARQLLLARKRMSVDDAVHAVGGLQSPMFEKFPKATIAELSQEAEALVRFLEPDATQFLIDAAA